MPIKYKPFSPDPAEGQAIRNGEKSKDFWAGTIRSEKKPLRLKIRNICGDETVWEIE